MVAHLRGKDTVPANSAWRVSSSLMLTILDPELFSLEGPPSMPCLPCAEMPLCLRTRKSETGMPSFT